MSIPRPDRGAVALLAAGLALADVAFAQARTPAERVAARDFPSIFQAWSPAENLGESPEASIARHDLYFTTPAGLGFEWAGGTEGVARGLTAASAERARARSSALRERNPNLVVLAELRYRDAPESFLPGPDHPWWLRDASGARVVGWAEGDHFRLDIGNAGFRARALERAAAMMASGAIDGVMLDVWAEDELAYVDDRIALVSALRDVVGEDGIIVVNSNDQRAPRSAPFVNGLFMEVGAWDGRESWERFRDLMAWGEATLRPPVMIGLEIWAARSRDELDGMRAATTLSLTASNGYALFADANPLPSSDHLHDWYAFWDADLGRPVGAGRERPDGALEREFTNGTALHNPPANGAVTVRFGERRRSVATGRVAASHAVAELDGDLFLRVDDATAGGDALGELTPPTSIAPGSSYTVSVPYAVSSAAEIALSLQDTTDGWRTHAFARVPIEPGRGAAPVALTVAADAPPGSGYAWTAFLVPPGGRWPERLDARTVDGISLGTGVVPLEDRIGAYAPPLALVPGESVLVEIPYEAAARRTLSVSLQNRDARWETEGFASVAVEPGSGVASAVVTVDADAPAGANYGWTVYSAPAGSTDWTRRTDQRQVSGVTVDGG